jgi:hypothetical protein
MQTIQQFGGKPSVSLLDHLQSPLSDIPELQTLPRDTRVLVHSQPFGVFSHCSDCSQVPTAAVQILLQAGKWDNLLCRGYALQRGTLMCKTPNPAFDQFTLSDWQTLFTHIGWVEAINLLTTCSIFLLQNAKRNAYWQIAGPPICFSKVKKNDQSNKADLEIKRSLIYFNTHKHKVVRGLPLKRKSSFSLPNSTFIVHLFRLIEQV